MGHLMEKRVNRSGGWWALLLFVVSLGAAGHDVPLVEAVKNGDTAAVHALLEQRADVNAPGADGTTPLHWAVHRDDVETVGALIGAGANVQTANRYGVTPLSLACLNGNAAMVERLLRSGADVNAVLPDGETALMTAARTGNAAAVKVLLAHGADVRARESWRGQDALMWAAAEGHAPAAKVLLEHGADVRAQSNGGFTPLLFAARAGHVDVVKLLLAAGANVNETQAEGAGVLVLATHNAHFELAALLLDMGADPDINDAGYTPLHLAIQVRNPDMEGVAGPVPTGRLDSLDLIKALLAHGANPNARMTKRFLGLGANRQLPLVGATPFVVAAKAPDVPVMRLLLASGADPSLPTATNATPLMAAAGLGYTQGRSPSRDVEEVAAHSPWSGPSEPLEAVRLILELGADVGVADDFGFTALHGAAIRGDNSVVRLLVEKGAKLHVKNKKGQTPLALTEDPYGVRQQPHTAALLRELIAKYQ